MEYIKLSFGNALGDEAFTPIWDYLCLVCRVKMFAPLRVLVRPMHGQVASCNIFNCTRQRAQTTAATREATVEYYAIILIIWCTSIYLTRYFDTNQLLKFISCGFPVVCRSYIVMFTGHKKSTEKKALVAPINDSTLSLIGKGVSHLVRTSNTNYGYKMFYCAART